MAKNLQILQLNVITAVDRFLTHSQPSEFEIESKINAIRDSSLLTLALLRRESPECAPAIAKFFLRCGEFAMRNIKAAAFRAVAFFDLVQIIGALKYAVTTCKIAMGFLFNPRSYAISTRAWLQPGWDK